MGGSGAEDGHTFTQCFRTIHPSIHLHHHRQRGTRHEGTRPEFHSPRRPNPSVCHPPPPFDYIPLSLSLPPFLLRLPITPLNHHPPLSRYITTIIITTTTSSTRISLYHPPPVLPSSSHLRQLATARDLARALFTHHPPFLPCHAQSPRLRPPRPPRSRARTAPTIPRCRCPSSSRRPLCPRPNPINLQQPSSPPHTALPHPSPPCCLPARSSRSAAARPLLRSPPPRMLLPSLRPPPAPGRSSR